MFTVYRMQVDCQTRESTKHQTFSPPNGQAVSSESDPTNMVVVIAEVRAVFIPQTFISHQ